MSAVLGTLIRGHEPWPVTKRTRSRVRAAGMNVSSAGATAAPLPRGESVEVVGGSGQGASMGRHIRLGGEPGAELPYSGKILFLAGIWWDSLGGEECLVPLMRLPTWISGWEIKKLLLMYPLCNCLLHHVAATQQL